ncbi:Planctomycete cytochrome C [Rubripirellula obstinata]|uniref:Planctomycete cytochrome C n=1 Tax=Rubripirellula obstinata TaxID=406547 RepID=A0A5B1CMC1_9BACT|nr:PSD1 and planctomycete cytochrome C domain-containing protein [Rubripirellula obstinata]KAA1260700.1 Planctomycete cytochrome C [Rubripirellula obstinata]
MTKTTLFRRSIACLVVGFVMLAGMVSNVKAEELDPAGVAFFESKIRPVLIRECYSCHSNQTGNARGGLRLDTRQLCLIGGDAGAAVVPGDLDESSIWAAINYDSYEMPPRGKLPQSTIDDFQKWIEMGAPDPRETKVTAIKSTIGADDIENAKANFWAYQTPRKVDVPKSEFANTGVVDLAKDRSTIGSLTRSTTSDVIDRFVIAKLNQEGLAPAPGADARTLLRRLSFDLIGLPPTPAQLADFESDWKANPDQAVANAADRMLASDQFGERWGRHWLDVARYAESTGRGVNMTYPNAWRYRDFVIDSFNDDKPFNEFVVQQIAGDLMPAPTDEKWAENLVATTFLALGSKDLNERNPVQFKADLVDEQIDVTTRVFLGQSVACARCHDHKFDPIPQTDYYAMAGIFAGMKTYFGNPPSEFGEIQTAQLRRQSSLLIMPVDDPNPIGRSYTVDELDGMRDQIRRLQGDLRELGRGAVQSQRIRLINQIADLSSKISTVDESGKPRTYCMGVQDDEIQQDVPVLVRGEIDAPGQTVPRGFPQVLCSTPIEIEDQKSGRLEIAREIGSESNPLTARVMVNRIWQHLFGRGIVASPENFGTTGEAPSHPELLDYLAVDFMQNDWSVKSVIRNIVTSRTYRMSSDFDQTHFDADPNNTLLWRHSARRLDAEAMRDAMLQASGELDLDRVHGSEVAKAGYVRVRDGVLGNARDMIQSQMRTMQRSRSRSGFFGRGRPDRQSFAAAISKIRNQLDMEDATCRSVYLPVVRDELARSMEVFDAADPNSVIGTRESSNTANQSLYMMNNPFVIAQSDALANKIASRHKRVGDQISEAFQVIYLRDPTSGERSAVSSYIRSAGRDASATETLSAICQSLFASAEFRYLD